MCCWTGTLKKVQAKKFEAALEALRSGGGKAEKTGTAEGSAEEARAQRAERLAGPGPKGEGEGEDDGTDLAFAAGPKLLTPSPLREGVATFDAPDAVANEYLLRSH